MANAGTCKNTARAGHLIILRWCVGSGCTWEDGTYEAAAEGGHLQVTSWRIASGCPWDAGVCGMWAARASGKSGDLTMLQ